MTGRPDRTDAAAAAEIDGVDTRKLPASVVASVVTGTSRAVEAPALVAA